MAKAYKCDKCEKLVEYVGTTVSGRAVRGTLKYGWYPEEIELCRDCAHTLIDLLKEWWGVPKSISAPPLDLRKGV